MLRRGIVVGAHPEDHSVDVIMADTYQRIAGIQVLSHNGSGASGTADLWVPDEMTGNDKWDMSKRSETDQIAVIDFSGSMPFVIGFIYPQIGQMTFADMNRRVQRHSSDVYSTIDSAGNFELAWPNGSFFRLADTPDHEDLTGKDFDKKWAIGKNMGVATHVRLVLGNAGAIKADFHIDPSGNATLSLQGTCTINVIGNTVVNTPKATVNASESIELLTPLVHCSAALTVDGAITGTGGMAISGGSGASVAGNITVTGGDVKADNISLKSHRTSGIQPGSGTSGGPVP